MTDEPVVELAPPMREGDQSLEETLASRRSVRDFSDRPLGLDEISQLLWAGAGVTDASGKRTAPSAGALYPIDLYVVTPDGWYLYLPEGHRLEALGRRDIRRDLAQAALGQDAVADGAAVVAVIGVEERTEPKYGRRAERYVALEAGHVAQNILLQATAMGLGAVPIGAFDDASVVEVMGLPSGYRPLYLIPVGHPRP